MPQQTTSQARVIDPILSEIARGYAYDRAQVASALFPIVPVSARAGKIIEFDASDFQLVNSVRAPGANTKRVQFGHAGKDFALIDRSLEGSVPTELAQEAAAVPGLDLGRRAIRSVQNMMEIEREKEAADLARLAANYPSGNTTTLTGTNQWSDPASNPRGDIKDAREAVRQKIGRRPNTLVLGPKVAGDLLMHVDILDALSANTLKIATLDDLRRVLDIERIVVGDAQYWDPTLNSGAGGFVDVWGKDAILAYTDTASMAEGGSPAYGYTYQLEGYPVVEEPYYDRNTKTWYYPVTDSRRPVLAGAIAGYLIKNASA